MTRCQIWGQVELHRDPILKVLNKTIQDGDITIDFWIIKVHTPN